MNKMRWAKTFFIKNTKTHTLRNFEFSSNKICRSTGIKFTLAKSFNKISNDSATKVNLMPELQQILLNESLKFHELKTRKKLSK